MTTNTTPDLTNYETTDYQVWVQTPQGGFYAYRTGLIFPVAINWTTAWNKDTPDDVPPGSTFRAIGATTTFQDA